MAFNILVYSSFATSDRVYGVSTLITTAFDDGVLFVALHHVNFDWHIDN